MVSLLKPTDRKPLLYCLLLSSSGCVSIQWSESDSTRSFLSPPHVHPPPVYVHAYIRREHASEHTQKYIFCLDYISIHVFTDISACLYVCCKLLCTLSVYVCTPPRTLRCVRSHPSTRDAYVFIRVVLYMRA